MLNFFDRLTLTDQLVERILKAVLMAEERIEWEEGLKTIKGVSLVILLPLQLLACRNTRTDIDVDPFVSADIGSRLSPMDECI